MTNSALAAYHVGDSDERPWGSYVVTAVGVNDKGEEYCEKDITVKAKQVLSLQSHALRREHWVVTQGILTVVLDDKLVTLNKGQDIRIPLGGIHAMANLSAEDCIVHELQEGTCREEDIVRYADAYGRGTDAPNTEMEKKSLQTYNQVLLQIK